MVICHLDLRYLVWILDLSALPRIKVTSSSAMITDIFKNVCIHLIIENLLMNLWEKLYSYKKRLNFLLVFNLRSLFVKRESMNFFVEEISLLRCACFMCTENFGQFNVSTIYHSSDIYILSIRLLKFPININQIELLVTLDREMISA